MNKYIGSNGMTLLWEQAGHYISIYLPPGGYIRTDSEGNVCNSSGLCGARALQAANEFRMMLNRGTRLRVIEEGDEEGTTR